ncbi:MAG: hypothetical protein K8R68_01015 [Bacteroidales bacterium]|nr:hypothetical protein [Bacteroidales bacterium]
MELLINLEINQILGLIKQMPSEHKLLIKMELGNDIKENALNKTREDLTNILLSGPVMTEEEEENFQNINKYFDLWTKNAFA